MLEIDLLKKTFGNRQILGSCRLRLHAGERVSVLGSSGIGKSTLLRIIAGLDTNYDGNVTRPERIAFMFQEPNLLEWRNCHENLLIFHPNANKARAQAALEQVGLGDKGMHHPRQLSLGQQRRLALARTFLSQTDLVLLDEPFTSLDPKLKTEMLMLTRDLLDQSGTSMIHVTHDVTEVDILESKALEMRGNPVELQYNE